MTQVLTFAQKVRASNSQYIVLVNGETDSKACWYYVLSDKIKMPLLIRKCENKVSDLQVTDYGRILKAGWGKQPPQYIQDKIDREGSNYDDSEFEMPAGSEDQRFHVKTQDANDKRYYVFIEVYGHLAKEFVKVVNYGSCDISAYGKVIDIGWGDASNETLDRMRALGFIIPEEEYT